MKANNYLESECILAMIEDSSLKTVADQTMFMKGWSNAKAEGHLGCIKGIGPYAKGWNAYILRQPKPDPETPTIH